MAEADRQLAQTLAEHPAFSDAERQALFGLPIVCIVKAVVKFVACGVTNAQCQKDFIGDVLGCFGARDSADGSGGGSNG